MVATASTPRAKPADIFLSYAREDRAFARALSTSLRAAGWLVWWDHHLTPGEDFEHAIFRALARTRCVMVLWSAASIRSKWVEKEAEIGHNTGRLVPILIERGISPPRRFGRLHATDLSGWRFSQTNVQFRQLTAALHERLGFRRRVARRPSASTRVERRAFSVRADEYDEFRIRVERRSSMRVRLFATAAVTLSLLDGDDHRELGDPDATSFSTTAAWNRKVEVDENVWVDPGSWWLVVEGNAAPSAGVILCSLRD